MAFSEIDRNLLERCLANKPKAWQDFVDRFMGLVVHVINHTAQARSLRLSADDRDDLTGEVFLTLVKDDFAVLRRFRGKSSLATYLTVVARRVVVHEMMGRRAAAAVPSERPEDAPVPSADDFAERLMEREEVERLLEVLDDHERAVVRMYHIEGRSYREIGVATGIAENSVGPTLTRARSKMRQARADQTAG